MLAKLLYKLSGLQSKYVCALPLNLLSTLDSQLKVQQPPHLPQILYVAPTANLKAMSQYSGDI